MNNPTKKPQHERPKNGRRMNGRPFSKENQPKLHGTQGRISVVAKKVLPDLTEDSKVNLAKQMLRALNCTDIQEARKILETNDGSLGAGGLVCQALARSIVKQGFSAIVEAYKLLFGAEVLVKHSGSVAIDIPELTPITQELKNDGADAN